MPAAPRPARAPRRRHLLVALLPACLAVSAVRYAPAEAPPTLLWWKDWNGPANHADSANKVLLLPDRSVLVAGSSYNPNPPLSGAHPALLRYGPDGALLWSLVESDYTTWSGLHRTSTGDVLVSGLASVAGEWKVIVRRLDWSDGSTVWQATRPAAPSFLAFTPAVVEDPATQSVLIATWRAGQGLVIRLAMSDGSLLGETLLEPSASGDDVATSVAALPNGGFVVAMTQGDLLGGYRVSAHDAAGRMLWQDVENGAIGNVFTPAWLGLDPQGNVMVGGGTETTCGLFEFRAWKLSPAGERLWTVDWPTGFCQSAEPAAFALAPDGSIAMAGQTHNPFDMAILHVSPSGELWTRVWNGPSSGMDEAVAVACDAGGNVIVGGSAATDAGQAIALVAYDPSGNQRFAWVGSGGTANGTTLVDLSLGHDGAAGSIAIAADGIVATQNANIFTGLLQRSLPPGDLDGDGAVGSADLGILLGMWGPCPRSCPADIDSDGMVGASDLAILIGSWT